MKTLIKILLIGIATLISPTGYSMQPLQFQSTMIGRCYVVGMNNSGLGNKYFKPEEIQGLLEYALSFRGTPYCYGASGPKRFDCSGFTSYVFRNFGYSLSRTASGQYKNGTSVNKNQEMPGDLVFFAGRKGGSKIGHVGIVLEPTSTGFYFIHASCSRGITVSHSTESYYRTRYLTACRILHG